MTKETFFLNNIPVAVWGEPSDKVTLYVHGKMSSKESAVEFAEIASAQGYQTISFDLPEHGERVNQNYPCNLQNGIADLTEVGNYVFEKWSTVSLFACSLGAFFSLHAYRNRQFETCLFQSPIVDMEYLIRQMFVWFHITEEQLKEQGEIATPVDTMSWDYYRYVIEHPIDTWTAPTHILYGAKDNLQSRAVIIDFAERFHCRLMISESSEHPFMAEGDAKIVEAWMRDSMS